MPREKEGCREVYAELRKQYPEQVLKCEAAKILNISIDTLRREIAKKKISDGGGGRMISLWNIAKYLVS